MEPKFYNSNGTLTGYALACGYTERSEQNNHWKQMYVDHNTIHVRYGIIGDKFLMWESFNPNELAKARKFYNSIKL